MTTQCAAYRQSRGGLAQLGEHLLCKQGVVGSIPSSSTTILIEHWPSSQVKRKRIKHAVLAFHSDASRV